MDWDAVPENNRALMIATVQNLLDMRVILPGPLGRPRGREGSDARVVPDVGDTVDYVMPAIGPGTEPRRATGTVVRVHADGFLEAEFEQDAPSPMTVTGPAEAFTLVRTTRGGSDG